MDKEAFFTKVSELKTKLFHIKKKVEHDEELLREEHQLDEERKFYEKEYPTRPQDKVLRESGGQDVSAI